VLDADPASSSRVALRGHLLEDLALALSGRGEHEAGLEQARRAVEEFRAAGAERAEAAALGTEAILLGRLDRVHEAVVLREKARLQSAALGDDRAVAAAHRDLGLLLARLGDVDRAISHERRSLELYTRIGLRRGVAMAAVNLGVMLRDSGRLAEARGHLECSVATFHEIGDRAELTEALEEIGYWHVLAGDPDLGLRVLTDGLALVDEADSGQWEASLRKRLGLALLRLGRRTEAEQHWRAALQIHARRGEWRAVAEAQHLLGTTATATAS
jgi:tetratricopeptide (TPR) repeat protein